MVFSQLHTLFHSNLVHSPRKSLTTIEYSSDFFERKSLRLDKCEVDDEKEDYNEGALNDVIFPGDIFETDWIDVGDLESIV